MNKKWWKEAIVYQIYPRSFYDSNNDGIGDLRGIIHKLDYIKDLGVNVIWLNPIYKSPNDDMGYDISDYQDIMEEFGTLADWDELVEGLHNRGIKLIMDLVVNHTSDEHKWFIEARESKENKYRDYYIWKSAENGIPNNWGSFFEGSTWELDEKTDEYYLHLFSKKQPDLNWENSEVREKIYEMMTWWLDKGIDGFRMDVINMIAKEPEFKSGTPNKREYAFASPEFINQPKVHDYLQEMNNKVLSRYDIMTVGECPAVTPTTGLEYVNESRNELNMLFQFEHMALDGGRNFARKDWKLSQLKEITKKWSTVIDNGGWNSNYLMNHDQPRAVSRFGDDKNHRKSSAKMLAMFTITLPGTPYIYQGEEIGMTNAVFNDISEFKDLESINMYKANIKNHDSNYIINELNRFSRDHSRTPIQWDESSNGGFSKATPWLKINANYKEINVKEAQQDENSILNFYKKIIEIRKNSEVLNYGNFEILDEKNEDIFTYTRTLENEEYLIILNFKDKEVKNTIDLSGYNLVLSNYNNNSNTELRAFEARLLKKSFT